MTMEKDIMYQWFQKATELEDEEELFVPVNSMTEQRAFLRKIRRIFEQYLVVDPILATSLEAISTLKEGQRWIKIRRKRTSPLVGFIRKEGKLKRVRISKNLDKLRTIKLMVRDGLSENEIIDLLDITKEELEEYLECQD